MKIDLHIHSKDGSDGKMSLEQIFEEASRRGIDLISITDHDSIHCQEFAKRLADRYGICYIYGVELNVTLTHPAYNDSKPISLDFLAYQYDIHYQPLVQKLIKLREFRKVRAEKILENINKELIKEGLKGFTHKDIEEIQSTVDGSFGRPHIANYMVKKGIVASKQKAFDKYLVKCNVPKMPLSLAEASELVHGAGGKLILAHPNDPNGTSLISFTRDLHEQFKIIKETMLPYIDGIECWHSRHDKNTTESYLAFAKKMGLMVTGGSDCHQQPILMGTVDAPDWVAEQFGF
ncbi:MAG: PHP domain-containing protein [Deltaproteobacteria bacterium]|nr:PHP domain-containing protein [Deltaproteobacteria bacterium]